VKTRWHVAALLSALALAGCGATTSPSITSSPQPGLSISNGTTLTVTLVVNGTPVATFAPHTGRDAIPASDLPPLPWTVEARSPSGRVLTSMAVRAGDVWQTFLPNGEGSARGDGARVDLSCGRLDIWSGPPMSGPAPGPGSPGDCPP
jgi:hypothetical protein